MKKTRLTLARLLLILSISMMVPTSIYTTLNIPIAITVEAAYSKETIKKVQKKLNSLGYECGKADGIAGKKTKTSIKKYQKEHDLKSTGNINKNLLKSLGIKETTISESSSTKSNSKASSSSNTSSKNTTSSSTKKESIVYITRTGAKYHRSSCRYLSRSKIEINLSDAKFGYSPCSVCKP